MISENRKKVKRNLAMIISDIRHHTTLPQQKYLAEMMLGCLISSGLNLTGIAGSLKEETSVKHTLKRLQRNTVNYSFLLELSNRYMVSQSSKCVSNLPETELVTVSLDGGDIVHRYGKHFELAGGVYDGSTGQKGKNHGYFLNQAMLTVHSSGKSFPIHLEVYSSSSPEFVSANSQSLNILHSCHEALGDRVIWLMDRGYDSVVILDHLYGNDVENQPYRFVIRSVGTRHVTYKGDRISISDLGDSLYLRHKESSFSYTSVRVFYKNHPMTVIVLKGNGHSKRMYLMVEGHHVKKKDILMRIRLYFSRWKVEEGYRFMKQQLGIERCMVRRFSSIKTLLAVVMFSWELLLRIDQHVILSSKVSRYARREKEHPDKLKKFCRFNYYRLADGIVSLFAGCGALFQFRRPAKVFVRYAFDLVKFFEVGDGRRTIKKVPLKRYKSLLAI